MDLFISKNGQQLGPYSAAEVRNLLQAGTVIETDWAWHDGLPNWIPLRQIPGFVSAPAVRPPAPMVPSAIEIVPNPSAPPKSIFQKIGGGIVAGVVLLLKFKFLIYGALKTSISMLIMIWFYSMRFGWPFAAGFVFLIFVHEMGHVVAAKLLGMPVSAPLFIPFVGAFITMKENPRDAWTEALMAYGGPLAGCVGSWICLAIGLYLQTDWIVAVASLSFVINLFNMIPIPPLDGGRICAAISPWFWLIGIVLLAAALFYFHSWTTVVVLAIIVVVATLPRIKATFFERPTPEMQAYYNTHISKRLLMALMYLGLFAALMVGYGFSSLLLSHVWAQSGI